MPKKYKRARTKKRLSKRAKKIYLKKSKKVKKVSNIKRRIPNKSLRNKKARKYSKSKKNLRGGDDMIKILIDADKFVRGKTSNNIIRRGLCGYIHKELLLDENNEREELVLKLVRLAFKDKTNEDEISRVYTKELLKPKKKDMKELIPTLTKLLFI